MSERTQYPEGVPCWVETLQHDPERAAAFYASVFGWEYAGPGAMPGPAAAPYFVARSAGADVAGVASLPPGVEPAWLTHVRVASADDAARRAAAAGARVLAGPLDVAPAGRLAAIADPAGAQLCVWQARTREGAQRVNEAGAWGMSTLRTPDPETAERFYGELFGWVAEPFVMGGHTLTLWRLPGYVGGLPEQPVSREVVAAMVPADPGEAARWSVDFWVADADAAAASARAAGGAVLQEPHAFSGFRRAALADPEGAAFTVSALAVVSG
jgi:predicted enzyme related to lactoylglutathione lyase